MREKLRDNPDPIWCRLDGRASKSAVSESTPVWIARVMKKKKKKKGNKVKSSRNRSEMFYFLYSAYLLRGRRALCTSCTSPLYGGDSLAPQSSGARI